MKEDIVAARVTAIRNHVHINYELRRLKGCQKFSFHMLPFHHYQLSKLQFQSNLSHIHGPVVSIMIFRRMNVQNFSGKRLRKREGRKSRKKDGTSFPNNKREG